MTLSEFATETDLADFRALAESLMTSTVRVSYKTGRTAQDEGTGAEAPVYATRFESAAKFQSTALETPDEDVAGRREVVDRIRVDLPWDCPKVHQDDVVECLTSPQSRLVGRKFLVGGSFDKDFQTATRLSVKEMP